MTTLESILRVQHRLIRSQQALAIGISPAEIAARRRRAEWVRLFRGVYAVEPLVEDAIVTRCRAALLVAGEGAAISHVTTLSMLAGRTDPAAVTHVSVERRTVTATTGLAVHWVANHGPLTFVRGVLSVSPAAAVVGSWSVARDADERNAMLCAAVTDLGVPMDGIRAEMGRGIKIRGRKALEHACWLVTEGWYSALEIRYYDGVERAFRLPPALRQRVIRVRSGRVYRVDVLYERERIVIELDGRQHRLTTEARHADLLRDAELQAAGYTVLRFTWTDVVERPHWVAATVRAAIGSAAFDLTEVVHS